jgi:hypothetical protein
MRGAQGAIWMTCRPSAFGDPIEGGTVLGVAIANEHLGTTTERRDLTQLLRGPLIGWRARHGKVDNALRVHVDDEEGEDRTEPYVVELQEIAGHVV